MDAMTPYETLRNSLPAIEEILGTVFENKDLLMLAFVHRSFVNEHRDQIDQHNERLEFLGDSVLGLVMADYLFRRLPSYPEGSLSQLRSRLVDAAACAKFLQKLKLGDYILLGKGEQISEGRMKGSILADVFEAIIGAMYLDGGVGVVRSFIAFHFEGEIEEAIAAPARNYKAELQDYSQKHYQKPPSYRVIEESGPDHAKIFHVAVSIEDQDLGLGMGSSKKEAEQRAAFDALGKIHE
jgi:ribonuclease III